MEKYLIIVVATIICLKTKSQSSWLYANPVNVYQTSPGNNVGYGLSALNTAGPFTECTAFGYSVMPGESNGVDNSAAGAYAMTMNTVGSYNTAVGANALYYNDNGSTQGDQNTAIGSSAMYLNTDGDFNTAIGTEALYGNVIGSYNTGFGARTLIQNSGSSGMPADNNTGGGFEALHKNITGPGNTAVGVGSLHENRWGEYNTAVGFHALYLNDFDGAAYGMYNTAIGHDALYSNVSGWWNTAMGVDALHDNYNAHYNTAMGSSAMLSTTSGQLNAALGIFAMSGNLTGTGNTAIGPYSLQNYPGDYCTAVGYEALQNSSSSSADENVAIGHQALYYNSPGSGNTCAGAFADQGSSYSNSTAFGMGTSNTLSNQIWLGNTTVSMIEGKVTPVSDARFKFDVKENVKGMEFISKLRPVTYEFDNRKFFDLVNADFPDSIVKKKAALLDFKTDVGQRQTGFLAQDVALAAKECNFQFNGVEVPEKETGVYGLSYELFVVPLVKAVQEQQPKIAEELKRARELNNKLKDLQVEITLLASKKEPIELSYNNGVELVPQDDGEKIQVKWNQSTKVSESFLGFYDEAGGEIKKISLTIRNNQNIYYELVPKGTFICAVFGQSGLLSMSKVAIK